MTTVALSGDHPTLQEQARTPSAGIDRQRASRQVPKPIPGSDKSVEKLFLRLNSRQPLD
jgi:hypothetical protein